MTSPHKLDKTRERSAHSILEMVLATSPIPDPARCLRFAHAKTRQCSLAMAHPSCDVF